MSYGVAIDVHFLVWLQPPNPCPLFPPPSPVPCTPSAQKTKRLHKQKGLLDFDPFARIDEEGVGGLIKTALSKARDVSKDIKVREPLFFQMTHEHENMTKDWVAASERGEN